MIGGVIGAAGSYMGAREQNRGNSGQGRVDITHQTNPYPGSDVYRNWGSARAFELLFGATPPAEAPGFGPNQVSTPTGGVANVGVDPFTPSPTATTSAPSRQAPQTRVNRRGQTVPVRNPAGGGGGAAKPAPFQGQSAETAAAIGNASRIAGEMENSGVTRAAQDYTAGTLGGEDRNAYRTEAAGMVRGLDTSNSDRLISMLFNSDTGLGGNGSGGGSGRGGTGGAMVSYGYQPGTGGALAAQSAEGAGPVGASRYLKDILDGGDTPYAPAMRERIKRGADEAYNEALRQRRLEASGSNMYGGSGQMADEAWATARYGAGLADAYAAQDYDTYRQALGLASAYDTSSLDRQAQERMQGASLSASGGAQAAALASQERMGRLDALSRAIEYGGNYGLARAGAMGDIGSDYSTDQRFALGASGDVNGMGQAGWLNAGGLSLGSDQARNAWQSSANQLAASRASAGVARAGLDLERDRFAFDQQRYAHDQPWTDTQRFMSIISGAYDPFSSTRDIGYDRRSGAPSAANPWGAAISGAAAGAQLGGMFGDTYGANRSNNAASAAAMRNGIYA